MHQLKQSFETYLHGGGIIIALLAQRICLPIQRHIVVVEPRHQSRVCAGVPPRTVFHQLIHMLPAIDGPQIVEWNMILQTIDSHALSASECA